MRPRSAPARAQTQAGRGAEVGDCSYSPQARDCFGVALWRSGAQDRPFDASVEVVVLTRERCSCNDVTSANAGGAAISFAANLPGSDHAYECPAFGGRQNALLPAIHLLRFNLRVSRCRPQAARSLNRSSRAAKPAG